METLWEKCLERLKDSLGKIPFDTWIAPLHLKNISKGTLILEAPDVFFKQWVESNYLTAIKEVLKSLTHQEYIVTFEVNPNLLKKKVNRIFRNIHKTFQEEPLDSIRLNPRFTFDKFIVGPSNRMAYAASMAVATTPGGAYNPLFIYGGVGLGKTHLMQAIAHYVLEKDNQKKVKYISSERFTNELILSIQNRTTQRFRQKYRNIDMLLIDDIHFLAGKEAVQEEFFHTFNELYDYHKQIVVSSDRPPKEIPKLEARLISRFSWGLVVDIHPPDLETRIAILKKKIENEPINIDEEVLYFIAENITTNIRELEGALIRIIAYSLIENKTISLNLARDILKDMVKEIHKKITPQTIIEKVADYYGVTPQEIKRGRRNKNIVLPRQVSMYVIRELTELSLPEISHFLGVKHHTTILYACKKIKEIIKKDKKISEVINSIIHSFKR